jgi:hypothetical protein
LGIDSLGRTELVLRLERAFGVRLPISLVGVLSVILSAPLSRPGRPGQQATLRLVGNAEPVSVAILRQFIDRFAAYGFRPGAMAPVYGLAENAVAVTLLRSCR